MGIVGGLISNHQRESVVGMQSPVEIWEAAIAATREKSPASFDQWFSGWILY